MSVAKQTVLGTGRAITRHDCWNKMSASRAVLYLKMDHSAGEGYHLYQYGQLVRTKFWCVGPSSLFHTDPLYVAHSFETSANLLGEGQTRAQIPKQFFLYPPICLIVQYLWKTVQLCRTFVTASVHFSVYRGVWKNLAYFQFNVWSNGNVDKFC